MAGFGIIGFLGLRSNPRLEKINPKDKKILEGVVHFSEKVEVKSTEQARKMDLSFLSLLLLTFYF